MYLVTSIDLCAQGYERLRRQSEIILLAYPTSATTPEELKADLIADLDSCMRDDGFDYDAATAAIETYFADNPAGIQCHIDEAPESWEEDMEGAFFMYLETEEEDSD